MDTRKHVIATVESLECNDGVASYELYAGCAEWKFDIGAGLGTC